MISEGVRRRHCPWGQLRQRNRNWQRSAARLRSGLHGLRDLL